MTKPCALHYRLVNRPRLSFVTSGFRFRRPARHLGSTVAQHPGDTVPRCRSIRWNLVSPPIERRQVRVADRRRVDERLSRPFDLLRCRLGIRGVLGWRDRRIRQESPRTCYGAPVVAALDRYRREHGDYPTSLGDLVPAYMAGSELRAPEASMLRYPFEYRADSGSYELLVRYVDPGMNECRYTPRTAWHCGGYF
jgi:hypothetical protein